MPRGEQAVSDMFLYVDVCFPGLAPYFSKAGTIVFAKPAIYLVDGWGDFGELLTVCLFGLGAHAGYGQDLSILYDALLQLAKQDPKACETSARCEDTVFVGARMPTCGVVGRPETILKARHDVVVGRAPVSCSVLVVATGRSVATMNVAKTFISSVLVSRNDFTGVECRSFDSPGWVQALELAMRLSSG